MVTQRDPLPGLLSKATQSMDLPADLIEKTDRERAEDMPLVSLPYQRGAGHGRTVKFAKRKTTKTGALRGEPVGLVLNIWGGNATVAVRRRESQNDKWEVLQMLQGASTQPIGAIEAYGDLDFNVVEVSEPSVMTYGAFTQ